MNDRAPDGYQCFDLPVKIPPRSPRFQDPVLQLVDLDQIFGAAPYL